MKKNESLKSGNIDNQKVDAKSSSKESPKNSLKSILSRLTRKAKILIISAIVVVILVIVIFRINFLIGEQLRVTLSPEYAEANITSPGNVSFEADARLYNRFVCHAVCNYTLEDISHDTLLDSGSFSSKSFKNKDYTFNIPVTSLGYGVNTYLYRMECVNIKTAVCPSSDDALVRKSVLVVTYHPSDAQLSAADFSEKNYYVVAGNLVNASKQLLVSKKIFNDVKLPFDKAIYDASRSELDVLEKSLQGVSSVWSNDDYISAKSIIVNDNLVSRSVSLLSKTSAYNAYLIRAVDDHNNILVSLDSQQSRILEYKDILSYNLVNDYSMDYSLNGQTYHNSSLQKAALAIVLQENSQVTSFNGQNYNSTVLYTDISSMNSAMSTLDNAMINSARSRLSEIKPSIYVYSKILCTLEQKGLIGHAEALEASEISDANTTANTPSITDSNGRFCNMYDDAYNAAYDAANSVANSAANIVYINNLTETSWRLESACTDASMITDELASLASSHVSSASSNESGQSGQSGLGSGWTGSIDSMELLLMQYKFLIEYESLHGASSNVNSYMAYVANSLKENYNISHPEDMLDGYVFNASLLVFSMNNSLLSSIDDVDASCNNPATLPSLIQLTAKYYSIPDLDVDDSDSGLLSVAGLPEIVSQCCMYGKCQSCDKAPSGNPLILLHGHSFNQDTHAYQSIEIFNDFEQKFGKDEYYFQTGLVAKTGNSTKGILGHYPVPLVSRQTYYLETYNDLLGLTVSESKTGNIDTYALRLKESIDYTLYVTGSDKVDIVAHSMGGLVVRRYMQVFGTEHIGKVILVGTPNQGISDKAYALCKIFGESNECDDMKNDGLFIKKLNDLSNQPDIKELYLVIGIGCDTDGKDGDGVVSADSVLLRSVSKSHILYVNGTCTGTTFLHNELLDPVKYPKVYNFVEETLK